MSTTTEGTIADAIERRMLALRNEADACGERSRRLADRYDATGDLKHATATEYELGRAAGLIRGANTLRQINALLRDAGLADAKTDPPAKTYSDDFANGLALASYGAMHDREDETPRMGETR